MSGFVIDTPAGIEQYRRTAIVHGLRMEIEMSEYGLPPTACPTRGRALRAGRRLLSELGVEPVPRQRKTVLSKLEDAL